MTTIESQDPSLESEGASSDGGAPAVLAAPHAAVDAPSRTLPPDEVEAEPPRSAASLALERFELDTAVARRTGPRAELATLSANLNVASRSGNEHDERS